MPTSSDVTAPGAIDVDVPVRLRAVIGKLSKRLSASSRGSGLTQTQLSALGVIARSGPIRMSELAEIENVNPTMLSRIVAHLDDAGLVRRRTDDADRRAALVEVTAAGRRTHDRLRAERGRVLADGLAQLSEIDRRSLEAALPALELLVAAVRTDGRSR
jgi:DNA-binding MarR family transcriptional regulator